ncbi:dTDP-4-dehydrorhamnose reductase [Kineococcus sp. SYSU DK001]|uniref:dTDP-4-dehydrorhamnose reductase n=1 Tax=Kineococcus sp. SYSU DK001 TaxID=3383122 RepID=UPI003D7DFD62
MRWMVTGAGGLLGHDVVRAVHRGDPRADVVALTRRDLDVLDADACHRVLAGADVVVNCAAWTAVDRAETEEAAATAVNAGGAAHVAAAAAATGARLVHVSTDYVFDGRSARPYRVQDPTGPVSAYGRGKLAGERAVAASGADALVVRTAWCYGAAGACFPRTVLRLARERGALSVVDDQVGQPTWTADVARVIVDLVLAAAPAGTYHATAAGRGTWWDFAREVVAAEGLHDVPVRAVTTDAFPTAARRPGFSALDTTDLARVGVEPVGDWRDRWAVAAREVLAGARELV